MTNRSPAKSSMIGLLAAAVVVVVVIVVVVVVVVAVVSSLTWASAMRALLLEHLFFSCFSFSFFVCRILFELLEAIYIYIYVCGVWCVVCGW